MNWTDIQTLQNYSLIFLLLLWIGARIAFILGQSLYLTNHIFILLTLGAITRVLVPFIESNLLLIPGANITDFLDSRFYYIPNYLF